VLGATIFVLGLFLLFFVVVVVVFNPVLVSLDLVEIYVFSCFVVLGRFRYNRSHFFIQYAKFHVIGSW
jgi:hypothetical protein